MRGPIHLSLETQSLTDCLMSEHECHPYVFCNNIIALESVTSPYIHIVSLKCYFWVESKGCTSDS